MRATLYRFAPILHALDKLITTAFSIYLVQRARPRPAAAADAPGREAFGLGEQPQDGLVPRKELRRHFRRPRAGPAAWVQSGGAPLEVLRAYIEIKLEWTGASAGCASPASKLMLWQGALRGDRGRGRSAGVLHWSNLVAASSASRFSSSVLSHIARRSGEMGSDGEIWTSGRLRLARRNRTKISPSSNQSMSGMVRAAPFWRGYALRDARVVPARGARAVSRTSGPGFPEELRPRGPRHRPRRLVTRSGQLR